MTHDIEILEAEKLVKREKLLFEYEGKDKIVLAEDKWQEIKEERKTRPPFRASTGLLGIDECVDGFRLGQLIVVSGPPKNGKSQLCSTFTKRFVAQGHQCLWLQYELGYEELFEKFPMEKLEFYVPNVMRDGNLKWVEDRIEESKLKKETRIVFIDHLDFLRDMDVLRGIDKNLASYIGGIVQKLKSIAVKHNLLIFLMAHIRKNKWTSNDIPTSEELRDSGQIAQLADMVMMIVRRRAKESLEIYEGNQAIVSVVENRHNGKTKKVSVVLSNGEFLQTDYHEEEPKRRVWN